MQEPKKNRTAAPWLRRLIAAAAVIALVICIPVTAEAFGWQDLWNIFARWAKETFSFVSEESAEVSEPTPEYVGEYTSLQEVLRANNRNANIVPTWIPARFMLENIEKDISPLQEVYWSFYLDGEDGLTIRVQNHISTDIQNIEVEEGFSELYIVSNTNYYLFDNREQIQIVWIIDSFECIISGNITYEEAKMMIDSIEKG